MLIGRNEELATLERHLAERTPVVVAGTAGIGKTTVIREVASGPGRRARIGQGLRTLSWMSYLPLERSLGLDLADGDDGAKARKIAQRLGQDLLIIDDLQWADVETVRLMPHLGRLAKLVVAIRTDDPSGSPTLDVVREAGFVTIDLEPLADRAAETLLRRRRPTLSALERRDVLRRAGGNPMMLEELQPGSGGSLNLRIVLAGLVHGLSPGGQRSMAVLGLLGRAAETGLMEGNETELIEAGVALRVHEGLVVRYALLGEVAVDAVPEHERRRLHAWLAARLDDPGEAARHHLAAGEVDRAKEQALLAADRAAHAGERARSLLTAVDCDETGNDELRLRTADALIHAGDYGSALRVVAFVNGRDPHTRAQALLHEARAARALYGQKDAIVPAEEAFRLVEGTGTELEVHVLLERARVDWKRWGAQGVELARRALAIATGTPLETACMMELGSALYAIHSPQTIPVLRTAIQLATAQREVSLRCEGGVMLAAALHVGRRVQEALEELASTTEACRAAGLRAVELDAMWLEMLIRLECLGDLDRAIALGYELVDDPGSAADARHSAAGVLAIALLERGRVEEAQAILHRMFSSGRIESVMAWLARAELELLLGKPKRAIRSVDEAAVAWPMDENLCFLWPLRGWASLELGSAVLPFLRAEPIMPQGSLLEVDALSRLADGRGRAAERRFEEAAAANHGIDLRAEFRCLRGAGEAALHSGAEGRARTRLLEVEEMAEGLGMQATLSQIRSSLRAAGVRRTAARGARIGEVTPRERETLELVGRGHDSRAIAGVLGIAPETVDDLTSSAMVKLGTKTRIEAAKVLSEALEV